MAYGCIWNHYGCVWDIGSTNYTIPGLPSSTARSGAIGTNDAEARHGAVVQDCGGAHDSHPTRWVVTPHLDLKHRPELSLNESEWMLKIVLKWWCGVETKPDLCCSTMRVVSKNRLDYCCSLYHQSIPIKSGCNFLVYKEWLSTGNCLVPTTTSLDQTFRQCKCSRWLSTNLGALKWWIYI